MSNITKKLLKLTSSRKTVFTTNDLALLWNIEDKNVLRPMISRAFDKGYLESIRRGVYKLPDREVDVRELAGKLKKLSYISMETVLAQAGVIFQWYEEIISASDRNYSLKNQYGEFRYERLPQEVLLNNRGITGKGNYFEATPERALCDKVYKDGVVYFDDLSVLNPREAQEISKIYNNKRLERDIKNLFL